METCMPNDPGSSPIPPEAHSTRKESSKSILKELGIEFLVELLLFVYPYGADQMNLPHNFWVGLVCWIVGAGIAIRMFWIFPMWADYLSIRLKLAIVVVGLGVFVWVFYRPVTSAHAKWVGGQSEEQGQNNRQSQIQSPQFQSAAPKVEDTQMSPPVAAKASSPKRKHSTNRAPDEANPSPEGYVKVAECPSGYMPLYIGDGVNIHGNYKDGVKVAGNVCLVISGQVYIHDNKGSGVDAQSAPPQ